MLTFFKYTDLLYEKQSKDMSTFYSSNGYLIIENFFDKNLLNKIEDRYEFALKLLKKNYKTVPHAILMPHNDDEKLFKIIKTKNILKFTNMLLKNIPQLLQTQFFTSPPGAKGFSTHQDNYYNNVKPNNQFVAMWAPLDLCNKENGTMYLYPKSQNEKLLSVKLDYIYILKHIFGKLFLKSKFKFSNHSVLNQALKIRDVKNYKKEYLNLSPGDACFIHGNLIHGSSDNISKTKSRRVLLVNFLGKGSSYTSGIFAKRKPEPLE